MINLKLKKKSKLLTYDFTVNDKSDKKGQFNGWNDYEVMKR